MTDHSMNYTDVRFDDVVFQARLKVQKEKFGYGLMSMDDVVFTDSVSTPEQDKRAPREERKLLADGDIDGLLARNSGAETKRQKALRHILHEAKHPMGSIWDWCKRGNTRRGRYRRWRSAQYFAQGQRENASNPDEWKKWNHARQAYKKMKTRVYKRIHDRDDSDSPSGTMTTLDGKPCPAWIASRLIAKRNSGVWDGILVSGYRTPEYSEQLCYNICGRPSCPGLCAGRSSNHCAPPTYQGVPYEGACDLSLYWQFPEGDHLINNLPRDLVHFSNSGY